MRRHSSDRGPRIARTPSPESPCLSSGPFLRAEHGSNGAGAEAGASDEERRPSLHFESGRSSGDALRERLRAKIDAMKAQRKATEEDEKRKRVSEAKAWRDSAGKKVWLS